MNIDGSEHPVWNSGGSKSRQPSAISEFRILDGGYLEKSPSKIGPNEIHLDSPWIRLEGARRTRDGPVGIGRPVCTRECYRTAALKTLDRSVRNYDGWNEGCVLRDLYFYI